jgi:CelD/BcsL family acetyltransferase involved in cellulose biosynthesis
VSRDQPTVALRRLDELDRSAIDQWSRRRDSDRTLTSPFYDPAFTQAIAAAGGDHPVRVIVVGDDVFWPMAIDDDGSSGPVGGSLNDHQGLIGSLPPDVSAADVLREAGVHGHRFDHLPVTQTSVLARARWHPTSGSPFLDLRHGFEAYTAELATRRSSLAKALGNARRRLARDLGPITFTWDDRSAAAYDALVTWKSAQYRATGVPDLFAGGWTSAAIDRLRWVDAAGCTAVLSSLRAGDHLVSVHLGLRSATELDWWLPAYDADVAGPYSVGLQLLWSAAEQAEAHGIDRIDLGKGDEDYKRRVATGTVELATGVVEPMSWRVAVRRARTAAGRATRRRSG